MPICNIAGILVKVVLFLLRIDEIDDSTLASKLSVRIKGVNRNFCLVDWDETVPPFLTPPYLQALKYAAKCVRDREMILLYKYP